MKYVYRDPDRLRGRPVHAPEDAPEPAPQPAELPPEPKPKPPKPYVLPPKTKTRPLPPPLWGGALGLELAFAEVMDWERRNPHYHHPPKGSS